MERHGAGATFTIHRLKSQPVWHWAAQARIVVQSKHVVTYYV